MKYKIKRDEEYEKARHEIQNNLNEAALSLQEIEKGTCQSISESTARAVECVKDAAQLLFRFFDRKYYEIASITPLPAMGTLTPINLPWHVREECGFYKVCRLVGLVYGNGEGSLQEDGKLYKSRIAAQAAAKRLNRKARQADKDCLPF